jgi:glycosyltransferase involved in cell wall biosynthesis
MKILQVGIGVNRKQSACHTINVGLKLNDHEVDTFEYRALSKSIGLEEMNDLLVKISVNYDLIIIGKGELIKGITLKKIKNNGVKIIYWYGDQRETLVNFVLELLPHVDLFLHVSGGDRLMDYHVNGKPKKSMYFLMPSNKVVFNGENSVTRPIDIIFPARKYSEEGVERLLIKSYLSKFSNAHLYGYNKPELTGDSYINALLNSNIGVNINHFMKFDKCTSNRLIHYMSSGVLVLTKYSPNMDLIYKDNEDLVFFYDLEDFKIKLSNLLTNRDDLKKISLNGMRKVHEVYNTKNIMNDILNVLDDNNIGLIFIKLFNLN